MSCVPVNASYKTLEASSSQIALADVLLIWPFGDSTHNGVLNFNGHLKVGRRARTLQQLVLEKDKSSAGPRSDVQHYSCLAG